MKNKIIKKISGLFGYKLVEKDYIKNIPTINSPRNKRIAKGQL